jgi:F-type H+-transporting ATPase subunit a
MANGRMTNRITARKAAAGASITRLVLAGILIGCCWLLPARAQETGAPTNAPGHTAEGAAPAGGGETTAPSPTPEPAAPTHEAGTEPGAAGHESEGTAGGHEGGAAHAGGGHKEEGVSIHQPTWLTGLLKRFWYSGPATVNAAGAAGAAPEQLRGKPIEFDWADPHGKGAVYHVRGTIGEVGAQQDPSGVETATATVDGSSVTLIKPEPKFLYETILPEATALSLLTALTIALVACLLTRNLSRVPGKTQVILEMFYEWIDGFVRDLIGPHYKRYLPLAATAFIYILVMNLAGLIPGWASPTANVNVTAGLALVVVLYVQYEGIRVNGFVGYLKHFMGEPWWLAPLNFPLHIIGEFARLLSLSIRLFGNIFGEDVVIVILILLSLQFTKGFLPVHALMDVFAIFTSLVQALVFTMLTCIYLQLMTAHGHDEHGHGEGHGHDHGHGHAHDVPAHAA